MKFLWPWDVEDAAVFYAQLSFLLNHENDGIDTAARAISNIRAVPFFGNHLENLENARRNYTGYIPGSLKIVWPWNGQKLTKLLAFCSFEVCKPDASSFKDLAGFSVKELELTLTFLKSYSRYDLRQCYSKDSGQSAEDRSDGR